MVWYPKFLKFQCYPGGLVFCMQIHLYLLFSYRRICKTFLRNWGDVKKKLYSWNCCVHLGFSLPLHHVCLSLSIPSFDFLPFIEPHVEIMGDACWKRVLISWVIQVLAMEEIRCTRTYQEVCIIMYLPSSDALQRKEITEFFNYKSLTQENLGMIILCMNTGPKLRYQFLLLVSRFSSNTISVLA
jgi:hypothetical protein